MGLLIDINANPTAGFRADFLLAGGLVATLGMLSAALIHRNPMLCPWAEARRGMLRNWKDQRYPR